MERCNLRNVKPGEGEFEAALARLHLAIVALVDQGDRISESFMRAETEAVTLLERLITTIDRRERNDGIVERSIRPDGMSE